MRPMRAADHSPPSSTAVMEEYSYTSTHTVGHNGPVTESLYILPLYIYIYMRSGSTSNEARTLFQMRSGQYLTRAGLYHKRSQAVPQVTPQE